MLLQEWYLVHRIELHNHLKQRALETATLYTQCRITEVNLEGACPSVTLDDGRTFKADVLLGADGLHVCISDYQHWFLSDYRPHSNYFVVPNSPEYRPRVSLPISRWQVMLSLAAPHRSIKAICKYYGFCAGYWRVS